MKIDRVLIFFFFLFFVVISCNKKNKQYKYYREKFINSYNSLNYFKPNSERNKVELKNTYRYLEGLKENTNSKEIYYFDLLSFRLNLINSNYSKSLENLSKVKEINNFMYYFYRGVVYDIMQNGDLAIDNYKQSLKFVNEDVDYRNFINFLISNDYNRYLKSIKEYDTVKFNYYQKLKEKYINSDDIKRYLIVKEVFQNYIVPIK